MGVIAVLLLVELSVQFAVCTFSSLSLRHTCLHTSNSVMNKVDQHVAVHLSVASESKQTSGAKFVSSLIE